jgi:hypothetical protein
MTPPLRRRLCRVTAAGLLAAGIACAPPAGQPAPAEPAQTLSPAQMLVTVDRDTYRVERTADALHLTIVSTFTNRTAATVYLHPCGRSQPAFTLERLVSGEWRPAYSPPCPALLMLDPPRVASGASRTDTALVHAALTPNTEPRFLQQPIDGTYRMVYAQAYGSWVPNQGPGELLPLERRISGPFRIVE